MNGLYIGIGLTLILALLAALVGPFFVDWGTYRAVFEREATKIVGYEVTVIGEVDARLLPSPRIRFGDVVIGPVEAPLARIGRFDLDIEAAPLLRGDIRISELRFERPVVDLTIDGDGRPVLPPRLAEARDPSSVAIDQMEIAEGRLSLTDRRSGARFELGRIAAVGSAASLAGPWRIDGGGQRAGRELSFHLAGGRAADGAAVLKAQVTPGDDPTTVTAELVLRDPAGAFSLTGKASVERRGEAANGGLAASLGVWRAEAEIRGDAHAIEATGLTVALGPEERAAQFTGHGRLTLGAEPNFDLALTARQIELDRLVSGETGKTTVPATIAAEAATLFGGVGDTPLPGRIRVDVQGLVVGGGAVQELALEARTRPAGLVIEHFEARLPGRTRIEAAGRAAFADGGRFDGRVEVSAEQPAAAAAWWRAEAIGDRLDPVTVSANLTIAPGKLRADDLEIVVARARARGHFDWAEASGARVGLAAEKLELDQVTRLARLFLGTEASRRPASLALDLDAGQMVVGGVTAKGVAIGVTVAADDVAVERLEVRDLAGARLAGSGRVADPLGAPRGTLDLTMEAVKPEAPARALARLAGVDPATEERIVGFAAAAAPLNLALRFEGRSAKEGTIASGSLRGFAGGAEVSADAGYEGRVDDPRHAVVRLAGKLAGDKATPALVRLFGGGAGGAVAADVSVRGRPVDGLVVVASAAVGATSARIEGTAKTPVAAPATFGGRVKLATPDATALGALLGRPALTFERRLPVDLTALLTATGAKLSLGELAGHVGETALRGGGRVDLGARPAKVDAGLELDRLDLEAAAEMLVGGAIAADGTDPTRLWATTPLLGPPFDAVAAGTVTLSVDRAAIEDVGFDRLRLRLDAEPGTVRISAIDAGFAGGRLAGEATLGRGGDGVTTLSGHLSLDRAALADLVWRRAGRAVAIGRLDGDVTFSTSGRTAAALVAGLGGEGRIALVDARVVGLSGEALAATQVALGETPPTTEKGEGLFRVRLDASEADLARTDVAVALQAGGARGGR
ncbi:MAG: AsmA family protein, partial [Siculibacillus sp.]|nr:AsmA family protein [Siculibacillus sp.]